MARSRKMTVRTGLMAGVAVALLCSTPAFAQARQSYNIAAGDAARQVQALAVQSGAQVIAPSADLAGVRTAPVIGTFTPREALERMFAGTGLEVTTGTGGALVVTRAEAQASDAALPDAAAAAQDSQQVIVTGSRIERTGIDTIQAATVTDQAEIERRGYTNLIQALQDTPGFAPASNSALQTSQGTLGIAQSYANFFGLGSQRTLTLVNGRRFVSSNTASGIGSAAAPGSQVDINLIPVKLTERIETVAIGGAPIYGSDAIAGTINFILRRDYEGLEIDGQASISEVGDAANQTVQLLFGRNLLDDRLNVVLAGEYSRQEGMLLSDRFPEFLSLASSGDTDRTNGIPALTLIQQRIAILTEYGLPHFDVIPTDGTYLTLDGRSVADGGTRVQFDGGGNLIPFVPGARFIGDSGGAFRNGGDGVNPADHALLLSPNERMVFNLLTNYDVTDSINIYFEGSYAHTEGTKLSDLFQFASLGLGGPLVSIRADNAFLTPQAQAVLAANGITGDETFTLSRNLNDIADSRPATNELDVWQVAAGIRGEFDIWGESLSWDVSYNYGHSKNVAEFNQINQDRFLAAIDAVNVGGTIQCRSGGSCLPLNILGGSWDREAANAVIDVGIGTSINKLEEIQANIGGNLPFGLVAPIAFNIGAATRSERGEFIGNDIINGGLSLLGGALAFPDAPERGFRTYEVFGEMRIPLIDEELGLPVIRNAEFEGAIRYVDHSTAGGDITWSAGGRLEPRLGRFAEGLVLRGVFTHAIRAPAIRELFLNETPVARAGNDLCAPSRIDSGPNPAVRRANCTAALAAVGVTDPAAFNPTTNGLSPIGTLGGNPNLDNERADSWSVGFVWQPVFVPRLRLTMDYSRVDLTGAISQFTLASAQAACYDSPNFPNEGACQAFRRYTAAEAAAVTRTTRVAGDIAEGYLESFFNSARLKFSGIIAEADYRIPVANFLNPNGDMGAIRLGLKAFHIDSFETQASGAAVPVEAAGTVGTPEWRLNGRVGFSFDPVDLDVQVVWNSSTVGSLTQTIEDTPVNEYGDYTLVNTTLGFDVDDSVRLQFIVRNLFDVELPLPAQVSRPFNVYDPIGRTFTATASMRF